MWSSRSPKSQAFTAFSRVLILLVQLAAAAVGVALALAGVDVARGQPLVLPLVDQPGERARGEALLVEVGGDDQLLEQAQLVVGVEDGEVRLQPDQLGMAAQHLGADRVEGAEPRHPLDRVADQPPDALAHLARGLVGEGDRQDLRRPRLARVEQVREPRGERGGLAGARAREHQHRAVGGQHRLALRRVEAAEIGRVGEQCGAVSVTPGQVGGVARAAQSVRTNAETSGRVERWRHRAGATAARSATRPRARRRISALCHCTDCRRSAGAPMVGWALFPSDRVTIAGDPPDLRLVAGHRTRHSAPTCGTGLFYRNEAILPGADRHPVGDARRSRCVSAGGAHPGRRRSGVHGGFGGDAAVRSLSGVSRGTRSEPTNDGRAVPCRVRRRERRGIASASGGLWRDRDADRRSLQRTVANQPRGGASDRASGVAKQQSFGLG